VSEDENNDEKQWLTVHSNVIKLVKYKLTCS